VKVFLEFVVVVFSISFLKVKVVFFDNILFIESKVFYIFRANYFFRAKLLTGFFRE